MPGPALTVWVTGTFRQRPSHSASSTALALSSSALTETDVIRPGGWSRAEASTERQGVMRVQHRSVSPGR